MYIPTYQIQNVLNVYRRQLSQMPATGTQSQAREARSNDRVAISRNGQRQSIIDQVSAEIVDRIAQAGPQTRFEDVLAEQLKSDTGRMANRPIRKEVEFTYSVIDENNNKVTNTLPIENFSPLMDKVSTSAQKVSE